MPRVLAAIAVGVFVMMIAAVGAGAFEEIIFIDHENLRYAEDSDLTQFQVNEIKRNIDEAEKVGVQGYLLFAKETMEAMLTYDFEVDEIGNIGAKAFPPGSKQRREAQRLRRALREVVDYAQAKGVRLYFHSNQFIFPDEVLEVIKPETWGTAVCPAREASWAVYRGKINEFCSLFPGLSGLQITGDETQVSVLECECERCREMSFPDRVRRLTNATAEVAMKYDMEVQMRTWQRMGELGDPSRMEDGILGNVYFSIKNTDGDFRLEHDLDREFLTAAAPRRLIVEFDAWREYEGHNCFPCWMGDIWAPRIKFAADRGIPRLGVRLMWNSNRNPIFDRPWGNFVNIYAFLKLTENPDRSGQEILEQFVNEYYPATARAAAIELYRYSTDFQRTMYYVKDEYVADHSRVQDEDARDNLEEIQDAGFFKRPQDFETRHREIEGAYKRAIRLVDALGKDLPAEWLEGLKAGARIQRYVALATNNKLEALFLAQQAEAGKDIHSALSDLKARAETLASEWMAWDKDSYEAMNGDAIFDAYRASP